MSGLAINTRRALWTIWKAADDEKVLTIAEIGNLIGVDCESTLRLIRNMESIGLVELTVQPLFRVEFNEKAFKRNSSPVSRRAAVNSLLKQG